MTVAELVAPDPVPATGRIAIPRAAGLVRLSLVRSRIADVAPAVLAVVFGLVALLSVVRTTGEDPGPFTPATAVVGLSAVGWGIVAGTRLGQGDVARAVLSVVGAILGTAAVLLLVVTIALALAFPSSTVHALASMDVARPLLGV